ncbi:hypothetical protein OROHE_013248 [Orobanche hederae]
MEGGRKPSGSSLASDLFGEKDIPTTDSASGICSIFSPPPKVWERGRGREYFPEAEKKSSGNPSWSAKKDSSGVGGEGQNQGGTAGKEVRSYFQDEKVQPFHYSSSIYYGGQDVYDRPPQTTHNPPVFATFNKDGGEDDSGGASRGNWWQDLFTTKRELFLACRLHMLAYLIGKIYICRAKAEVYSPAICNRGSECKIQRL